MIEIWKPLKIDHSKYPFYDWPMYEVSNLGRLKRLSGYDTRGAFHKEQIYKRNSRYVSITKKGKTREVQIARLVLIAFVGDPPHRKSCALHKNDDETNNDLTNLYWGDRKKNFYDAVSNGSITIKAKRVRRYKHVRGLKHHNSKLTFNKAEEIRLAYKPKSRMFGVPSLAKKYDVSETTIIQVLKRKTWKRV